MCAGLAHESRNALQRSQACLEMLALKLVDRPDTLRLIGRVQQAQDDLHRLYEDVREYKDFPIPVILVSAYHDHDLIQRAEEDHILAFLVKPIKLADLEPAIAIAIRRFEHFQALRQEAADLRQALEDRKLIEKAKGLLMKRAGLDERGAFRRLQKLASERSRSLVEVAAMILSAEAAYQPAERDRDKDRPGGRHP